MQTAKVITMMACVGGSSLMSNQSRDTGRISARRTSPIISVGCSFENGGAPVSMCSSDAPRAHTSVLADFLARASHCSGALRACAAEDVTCRHPWTGPPACKSSAHVVEGAQQRVVRCPICATLECRLHHARQTKVAHQLQRVSNVSPSSM